MPNYKIYPLDLGTFPSYEKSILTYNRNQGEKIQCPILAYLVQGPKSNILVDTGPGQAEVVNKHHFAITRSPEQKLEAALAKLGVRLDEIDLVVFTHLHWDHCNYIEGLKNARFLVQEEEIKYAVSPLPIHRTAYDVGLLGILPAWMKVFDRMEIVRGDIEIAPGINLMILPGHSPGSQGLSVKTETGMYFIVSDAVPLFENWEGHGDLKHIPSNIHIDLSVYFQTLAKIERVADFILPGHDVKVLDHRVYPILPQKQK